MVNFKDMKGGDPEGQAKNNSKKPEEKPVEEKPTVYKKITQKDIQGSDFVYRDYSSKNEMIGKILESPLRFPIAKTFIENYPYPLSQLEQRLILLCELVNNVEFYLEDELARLNIESDEFDDIRRDLNVVRCELDTILEYRLRRELGCEAMCYMAEDLIDIYTNKEYPL